MARPIPLKTRIRRSVSQKKKSKGDDTTPRFMLGKNSGMTLDKFKEFFKKKNNSSKIDRRDFKNLLIKSIKEDQKKRKRFK